MDPGGVRLDGISLQQTVRVSSGPWPLRVETARFPRVCAAELAARSAETQETSPASHESGVISLSGHIPVPQHRCCRLR